MLAGAWQYDTAATQFARVYHNSWPRSSELDALCLTAWLAVHEPGYALARWLCTFANLTTHLQPVFGIRRESGCVELCCSTIAVEISVVRSGLRRLTINAALQHCSTDHSAAQICVEPEPGVLHGDELEAASVEARARRHGICDALTSLLSLFRTVGNSTMPLRERLRHCVIQCLAGTDTGHGQLCDFISLAHFGEEEVRGSALDRLFPAPPAALTAA